MYRQIAAQTRRLLYARSTETLPGSQKPSRPISGANPSAPRFPRRAQGDLFARSDARKQIDQLFRRLPKMTLPLAPDPSRSETFTPLNLLGEAFAKVGREHNDPQLEAAGLLLLGRKPH